MKKIACVVLGMVAGTASAQHGHEGDVRIAWDGIDQIMTEFDSSVLQPLAFESSAGVWIADEPGFMSLDADEPDEGLFVLPNDSFISIEVLSTTPGIRVLDPLFDPFTQTIEEATITNFDLGAPAFDDHPFWVVQLSEWDGVTTEFDVTLQVHDSGASGLAASEPVTVTFTIPTPAGASVFACGGLMMMRRRR